MIKELGTGLTVYFCVLSAVLGAVFGSFLNCAAWRIAHKMSFMKGRSLCPSCGHELRAIDLVPVLSWVFLKGKCRYCGEKISARYPLTELIFAALTVLLFLKTGLSVFFIRDFILLCCLFCLSLVDLDIFEIPNACVLIPIGAFLAAAPFADSPLDYLKTGAIGGFVLAGAILLIVLIFDKVMGKETMGGGDIKLLFVAGLYLGLVTGLFGLILACLVGLIMAVVRKTKKGEPFPFGPAIAIALWIMLEYGGGFVDWYLGLFT